MSWVCDNCSCNNDDEVNECFVCGTARSAESIRLARIKAIEKKREAFNDILYSRTSLAGELLMITASAMFIVACIIKIVQGSLIFDLENSLHNILSVVETNLQCEYLKSAGKYLVPTFGQKGETVRAFLSGNNITTLINMTIPLVQSKFEDNFVSLTVVITSMLPSSVKFDAMLLVTNLVQNKSATSLNVFEQFFIHGNDNVWASGKTIRLIGNCTEGKFYAFNKLILMIKNKYYAVILSIECIINNVQNSVIRSMRFIKHIVLK